MTLPYINVNNGVRSVVGVIAPMMSGKTYWLPRYPKALDVDVPASVLHTIATPSPSWSSTTWDLWNAARASLIAREIEKGSYSAVVGHDSHILGLLGIKPAAVVLIPREEWERRALKLPHKRELAAMNRKGVIEDATIRDVPVYEDIQSAMSALNIRGGG